MESLRSLGLFANDSKDQSSPQKAFVGLPSGVAEKGSIDYMRQNLLIFDIGCHLGEDSEFYLRKGFKVVAVEANPELCLS